MKNRKIAFIVNPISGTKNKKKMTKSFASLPWLKNDEVIVYVTKFVGDAYERAKAYSQFGFDIVVAVGGDGTVNEIARALVGTETALGIIPVGSGNGLARELKIPLGVRKAARLLHDGVFSAIDVCKFNENTFFCTAGVGLDAIVAMTFAKCGHRGFFWYLISTLKAYQKMKPTNYDIIADGKEISVKAFAVIFANAGQFGNNAYISPIADLRDGIIDMVVVRPFPWYKSFLVAMRLFRKNMHKSRYVSIYKCKKALLSRPKDDPAHFDGEPYMEGKNINVGISLLGLKVLISKKNV